VPDVGRTLSQPPAELANASKAVAVPDALLTERVCGSKTPWPEKPKKVIPEGLATRLAAEAPDPTVKNTLTTVPRGPAVIVTCPRCVPAIAFDGSAVIVRLAGVVPDTGLTDSHPVVAPT
jgi:hypothetical protein